MSTHFPIPAPELYQANDEVDWDFWLQASPPTSPCLTKIAAVIRPRLEQRSKSWNIVNRASPLRSPPIVFSNQALTNTVRPYGLGLEHSSWCSANDNSSCYFTTGNTQAQNMAFAPSTRYLSHKLPLRSKLPSEDVSPTSATTIADSPISTFSTSSAKSSVSPQPPQSTIESTPHKKKPKLSIDGPMVIQTVTGGSLIQWGKRDRHRTLMDEERKKGYRRTRTVGACPMCKKRRKQCNRSCMPYIECLSAPRLIFFDRPVDASLFRLRPAPGHPLLSTKLEIYSLTDFGRSDWTTRTTLSQRLGHDLNIELCEFDLFEDLKTSYVYHTYSRGMVHLELPRLCIANMKEAKRSVGTYVNDAWCTYLRNIIMVSDGITREVLRAAQVYVLGHEESQDCLVGRALKLLAVNRMIEVKWIVTGAHLPGVSIIDDPESPLYGQRPITPVMDTQLDQIIIQNFLRPLRDNVLSALQDRMARNRKDDWYEIFLTMFILQTNTALLLRHSRNNATSCGVTTRYQSIQLAQEYFHGSNILLAHFHHQCRGFTKLLQSNQDLEKNTTGHERDFLKWLVPAVQSQREYLLALRRQKLYETDLYWAQQMFFDDWVPESKEIL